MKAHCFYFADNCHRNLAGYDAIGSSFMFFVLYGSFFCVRSDVLSLRAAVSLALLQSDGDNIRQRGGGADRFAGN